MNIYHQQVQPLLDLSIKTIILVSTHPPFNSRYPRETGSAGFLFREQNFWELMAQDYLWE